MSAECWFLPTDDSNEIGPWVGPIAMSQGRSKPSLVNYQDKVSVPFGKFQKKNKAHFITFEILLNNGDYEIKISKFF